MNIIRTITELSFDTWHLTYDVVGARKTLNFVHSSTQLLQAA